MNIRFPAVAGLCAPEKRPGTRLPPSAARLARNHEAGTTVLLENGRGSTSAARETARGSRRVVGIQAAIEDLNRRELERLEAFQRAIRRLKWDPLKVVAMHHKRPGVSPR